MKFANWNGMVSYTFKTSKTKSIKLLDKFVNLTHFYQLKQNYRESNPTNYEAVGQNNLLSGHGALYTCTKFLYVFRDFVEVIDKMLSITEQNACKSLFSPNHFVKFTGPQFFLVLIFVLIFLCNNRMKTRMKMATYLSTP